MSSLGVIHTVDSTVVRNDYLLCEAWQQFLSHSPSVMTLCPITDSHQYKNKKKSLLSTVFQGLEYRRHLKYQLIEWVNKVIMDE